MPLPRSPRPKRAINGTRASRRNTRDSAWVLAKLEERFDRFAEVAELQRQQIASGVLFHRPAQEKAHGLATGGSSNLVIPGKDPGQPETQALATVPDRRATPPAQGRGGMTAFTD